MELWHFYFVSILSISCVTYNLYPTDLPWTSIFTFIVFYSKKNRLNLSFKYQGSWILFSGVFFSPNRREKEIHRRKYFRIHMLGQRKNHLKLLASVLFTQIYIGTRVHYERLHASWEAMCFHRTHHLMNSHLLNCRILLHHRRDNALMVIVIHFHFGIKHTLLAYTKRIRTSSFTFERTRVKTKHDFFFLLRAKNVDNFTS